MAGISGGARGWLGGQARAQYAAMAAMRWSMFRNGLRSIHGILDLGATGVEWMLYGSLGLGLAAGLGAGAYSMASHGKWQYVPILFWAAGLVWLTLPVAAASFQEQSGMGVLLRFPVRFSSFFTLHVISGLMDTSTIVGTLGCVGIWLGIALARPDLWAWTALALAAFAAFNILLVRAVFAWVERWLAQRKTREILGAVFMVAMLGLQLFNPAFYRDRGANRATREQRAAQAHEAVARYAPLLKTAQQVQQWMPPGLAARAVREPADRQPVQGLMALGVLGLWGIAAAGTLGWRLRAEYRGENLGAAPARTKSAAPERQWTLAGSSRWSAFLEKEARSLLRSWPLLWAMAVPLLMVLVLGGIFHARATGDAVPFPYGFALCVAYALLGFTQLFYNNLGTEGAGIQLLFLSPTPFHTFVLAKNILHGALFLAVGLAAGVLGSIRMGVPPAAVVAAMAAWLLFALPCNLAAGNVLSLTMPYRINPGRLGRQAGSQANSLTAILIQAGILAVGAAVFALCWLLGELWLAVPAFLALSVAAGLVWIRGLRKLDELSLGHRDALLATLMKTQ